MENPNLMELFGFSSNHTFRIEKGKVSFHYNPKLCLTKIMELKEKYNVEFDGHDVSEYSNGENVPCEYICLWYETSFCKISEEFADDIYSGIFAETRPICSSLDLSLKRILFIDYSLAVWRSFGKARSPSVGRLIKPWYYYGQSLP